MKTLNTLLKEKDLYIPKEDYPNEYKGKTLACCFHMHSDAGSLDGASSVDRMVKRMKALGMTHVTFSEHGTLNSAAAAHRIGLKAGLKVIHGVEAYLYWPNDKHKADATYHITIYFKTREAFEAYCKLTPLIYSEPRMKTAFGDVKGCMYWEDFLEVAKHGIVVGTACIGGWLNAPIIKRGDVAEAQERLQLMIDTIGVENIYDEWIVDDLTYEYEAQSETLLEPRLVVNDTLAWFTHPDVIRESNRVRWEEVTKPRGVKRIAAQDAHYAEVSDKIIQDNKRFGSDWIMPYYQHVKGAAEYAELAQHTQGLGEKDILELIDNTHEFVTHFDKYEFLTAKERGFLVPGFKGGDAKEEVIRRIKEFGRVDLENKELKERIDYELSVLGSSDKLDGMGYLLLVSDIATEARKHKILMNLRGSGSGCFCAYGLGVSTADPIKYGLQFERFLTLGRIKSMNPPDMDLDFPDRDMITPIINDMFQDRCIPISIDTLLKPRSAIRDAERHFFGKARVQTEVLLKTMDTVPQGVNETDWLFGYSDEDGEHVEGAIEKNKELQKYADDNPEIWSMVVRMCGVIRQKSAHPCGMLISSIPVHHFLPVFRVGGKAGTLCTGYNPKDVEYVGGLKVDILGVTKMHTIQKAFELIEQRHGVSFEWGELPHDLDVYKTVYWKGDTEGTFQTQTQGITKLCEDTKPESIGDIANLVAAYRPAVIDAPSPVEGYKNMLDYYVAVKQGKQKPHYIHPELEPIFGNTAGAPLLQEQMLRSYRDLAGYTYETAEVVRRGISKKDAQTLAEHGRILVNKLVERGWKESQALDFFHVLQASARYSFNFSHAVSYAVVSYATAFLKHKYPLEFWCAELSVESENEDKVKAYASALGNRIKQPDILKSHYSDWKIEDNGLRAPLVTIKGCGQALMIDAYRLVHADSIESLGFVRKPPKEEVPKRRKVRITA
jgi:DNA polymerase-3 subunit alpha